MEPKQPPITLWDELERLEYGNPPSGFSSGPQHHEPANTMGSGHVGSFGRMHKR